MVAVTVGTISAYKRGWSTDVLLNLAGVIGISAVVSFLLVVEIRRQLRCEIADFYFFTTEWSLKAKYPFIAMTQDRHQWAEVEDIGRSGYTLFLKMPTGKKKINLFGFKNPEEVAVFAADQWRSQRRRHEASGTEFDVRDK